MSSFGRRISTQYTESCHSAAAANQIDSCPRGVGHLSFRSSQEIQRWWATQAGREQLCHGDLRASTGVCSPSSVSHSHPIVTSITDYDYETAIGDSPACCYVGNRWTVECAGGPANSSERNRGSVPLMRGVGGF